MVLLAVMTAATAWAGNIHVAKIEVVDGLMCGYHVKGWAFDPNNPSKQVTLHLTVRKVVNNVPTSQVTYPTSVIKAVPRPDVNAAYNIPGDHGYDYYSEIGEGEYNVEVSVGDQDKEGITNLNTYRISVGRSAVPHYNGSVLELTPENDNYRQYKVGDGCLIKGKDGLHTAILIEDGATVTLGGVNFTTSGFGLECLGNATIVLAHGTTNTIYGSYECPGIYVPEGKTVTIRGSGSLDVRGSSHVPGIGSCEDKNCGNIVIEDGTIYAAAIVPYYEEIIGEYCNLVGDAPGIGAGRNSSCGNITIKGGNITSESVRSIGIGSATNSRCGNISITGGSVTAEGYNGCVGIGSGVSSTCGTITISGGLTYVKAIATDETQNTIGISNNGGACGTITIGGTVTGNISQHPYTYAPTSTSYTVSFNANGGTGSMANQKLKSNTPAALNTLTFTRDGYAFVGWNTKSDGSGHDYGDGQSVTNLGSVTLYAQWIPDPYYVHFNANGGTGTMRDQAITANSPEALNPCSFTRQGYEFSGWNTQSNGNGVSYADGQEVCNLPQTLYAQWTPVVFTITYENAVHETDNVTNHNYTTYTPEDAAFSLAAPERFGYSFTGWTWEGQAEPTKNASIPHGSTGNKIFTAHWTPVKQVTLHAGIGYYCVQDNQTISGTGGTDAHITIADGATVTLSNLTLNNISIDNYWSGITCEGDATIILADGTTNIIEAGNRGYAGIYVPIGKTLTIRGNGTLNVSGKNSNDYGMVNSAAGIGANYGSGRGCGNINIEGGTIIAEGGYYSAAIGGSHYGGCGDITISGGTVTVTGFYETSIGIGSGGYASCGNITITSGVTRLTSTRGDESVYNIGCGEKGSCGVITIGGVTTTGIPQSPFVYIPSETSGSYTVCFDPNATDATGNMESQTFTSNVLQALTANAFSRKGYTFTGWNTAADGSGYGFPDGNTIINLGNATLYAQWKPITYTITYTDAEDGKHGVTNTNPTTYTIESDEISLVEPELFASDFDGWTWEGQSEPTKSVTIPHGSTGDKTFTAHWTSINVSELNENTGEFTMTDGHTTTGTGGYFTHASIADGATVTLNNVHITSIRNDADHKWPGLTCLGDATIILQGDNEVNGGSFSPAIFVPEGKTLVIKGTGTLTVNGGTKAAAIGSAQKQPCGHIVINEGTVIATGGIEAAGIGSGYLRASCGDITINGGTVTVTGGADGAGIGTGFDQCSCGNITINGGTVTATAGAEGAAGIGTGYLNGSCGDITVNGGTVTANGGERGAAIGSGSMSTCGNITITDGTVIATGGEFSEAIGTGHVQSTCGTISIDEKLVVLTEGNTTLVSKGIILRNDADNTAAINEAAGTDSPCITAINGRTIYRNDSWNTLCVPFSLNSEQLTSSLWEGVEIKELDGSASHLTDGTLTLNFKDATSIEAGKPYIMKWKNADLIIKTTADWDAFADAVNNGETFERKLVKLGADINVSKMVGTEGNHFDGKFDGNGHTITVNLSGSGEGTALFYIISNAVIQNLKVTGSITTSGVRPATFASFVSGSSTIRNCWSEVDISSTATNTWVDGGAFVARVNASCVVYIYNSLFTGTVTYDATADEGGGMVGWTQSGATATLKYCLFAPTALTMTKENGSTYVFVSGNRRGSLTGCYYNTVTHDTAVLQKEGENASNMTSEDLLERLLSEWQMEGNDVAPKRYLCELTPIESPTFKSVTFNNSASTVVPFSGGKFVGTYSPVNLTANDYSKLYLGAEDKLYWPAADMTINAFRAYFDLDSNTEVKCFVLNFDGESEATGVASLLSPQGGTIHSPLGETEGALWYSIDGRRLSSQPMQPGLYIHNGRKVVIRNEK